MDKKGNFFMGSHMPVVRKTTLNTRGQLIQLDRPRVMGILNLTPDSFYDGNRNQGIDMVLKNTERMLQEGADMIDIGAHSSRPGARPVNEKEEMDRLRGPVEVLRKTWPDVVFSVDTFRSGVARSMVLDFEIDMINDVSGGDMDGHMFETIKELQVPYVFMHMQGTPQNMQLNPVYDDVVQDVLRNLAEKLNRLNALGVHDAIADPGFGFGKTVQHNYTLLSGLDAFQMLNVPILVGLSRKSMIYNVLNCGPEDALNGTTALNVVALLNGASILRVHDVAQAVEAVTLIEKLKEVQ